MPIFTSFIPKGLSMAETEYGQSEYPSAYRLKYSPFALSFIVDNLEADLTWPKKVHLGGCLTTDKIAKNSSPLMGEAGWR
jgi:hypothetical protein